MVIMLVLYKNKYEIIYRYLILQGESSQVIYRNSSKILI